MKRDLPGTMQTALLMQTRFLCRLNLHKWSYTTEVTRVCVCGCRQRLNEEDARDWAEFNWTEEK